MQILRVYTGDDGQSHFEDLPIEFTERGPLGRISAMFPARGVMFRAVDGDYDLDFHNAPRRQFVINLKGSVDIEIGDGTVRRLGPGDILLAEDVSGQGHKSRAVDGAPRECLFIPLG
ncbi:MAG: hypothetical protein U5Q16_05820 [Gammaproteobacteria bacterium]|nr:hypothetical protein [Gammaproteobacteria bacterium]